MKKSFIKLLKIIALILGLLLFSFTYLSFKYHGNINTGSRNALYHELMDTDGIGVVLTEDILENRPYSSWEDLDERVHGIGEEKLMELRKRFRLNSIFDLESTIILD